MHFMFNLHIDCSLSLHQIDGLIMYVKIIHNS